MPDSTYNTCIFIKKCLKYSLKNLQLYNFWRSIEIMLYIQTYWSRSSRTKEWNSFQYDKTITKTGANFILKTTIYTKHKINNLKFSHVIPWSHTANNLGWRLKYTHLIFVPVSQPLRDLVMGVSSLEASAIQINITHSILQFEINGTQYTSTAVATKTIVLCLDGQERNDILCSKISSLSHNWSCMFDDRACATGFASPGSRRWLYGFLRHNRFDKQLISTSNYFGFTNIITCI